MAKVTATQVFEAGSNWREFFKEAPDQSICGAGTGWRHIEQYLGSAVRVDNPMDEHFQVSDEGKRRLEMLASAHYKTILRVYCAKHGIRWK